MSFVKKLKDILFEEEVEENTEPIKIKEEVKKEDVFKEEVNKINKVNSFNEEILLKNEGPSERELFRKENSFQFPDFDEEEFASSMERNKIPVKPQVKPKSNALEYERKKTIEKRTDYGRYERVETKEYTEKKKFKPSPIISPVYGVLNQDYRAEDIVNRKEDTSNISIEEVRKKAFEPTEAKKTVSVVLKDEDEDSKITEPVVTFFEEKESIKLNDVKENDYKSIDDLLEAASSDTISFDNEEVNDEVSIEDTLEIPKNNNLDVIEEELEKLDAEEVPKKNIDDALDNDLFELIDSMYDDREEDK